MATILTKKKDTTGAPATGDLTNSSGGAELAVNTADKRLYTKDSGGNVVEVGTNPGTAVTFVAGTNSAPAITTTGDTNTGIFFPAADTIAFAEGGAERMRITSDGEVLVGGTTSIAAASGVLTLERSGSAIINLFRNSTTIVNTNSLGDIRFYGADTTGNTPTQLAFIEARASGAHGPGDNPTDLVFGTTADGSDTVAERMRIDSAGNVGIGTSSPERTLSVLSTAQAISTFGTSNTTRGLISFTDANTTSNTHVMVGAVGDNLIFTSGGSGERMRITSAGEVLVGGTTAIAAAPGLTINNADTATNSPALLYLFRNDTSILSGNELGAIGFYGNDTTSNTPTQHAYITAIASGTHAAGDNPTDLVFGTTPVGSATVAEVARFTQDKYLRMASGSGGIQFNGDTAAANALDDYEEGTWTPVIADATTGGNVSATAATSAIYTKVGRMVTVQCLFANISTVGLTAGNDLHIRGLPFTAASVAGTMLIPGSCTLADTTFTGFVNPIIFDNNTYLRFAETISGASLDYLVVSEFSTGAADIYLNITYQAA
jgi:hypothetical protein